MENNQNNTEVFDPIYWANLNNDKTTKSNEPMSSMAVHPVNGTSGSDDTTAQVTELAEIIVSQGIDITEGYGNWLKLGFALSDGLGEAGRGIYHNLSRMNADYDPAECDRQFDACLHSHGQGVTLKTFFQMAKDAGIDLSRFAKEHKGTDTVPSATCAKNANVPNDTDNEKEGKTPVSCNCATGWHDGTVAQMAQSEPMLPSNGKTFCDKIAREEWPEFCLPILDSQNDIVGKDKMILGSLNLVSGILPKSLYSIYDRRRVYAPLYNILYGGFATKKGDIEACKQLVVPIKNEMRRLYEAQKDTYDQEMAAWENAPKGGRGPAPIEPVMRTPFVAANSSTSAIYRTLDANEGWGLMFETEADTLTNMLSKSDYGDYSDLLRKAHHHECSTMVRVSEHLNIEIEEPRLSVLLTCTGSQLPLLLPASNVANGLASRFLFYALPESKVEFRNVFEGNDVPIEDIYKQLGQKTLSLYHALLDRESHPIQFLMTHPQQKEFVDTFNDVLKEQFAMLGNGIQGFIFRLALECYRYAMVLTALRRLSERYGSDDGLFDDDEQALVCDDRDFHIAMTIINCLVNHTGRVYAVIGNNDDDPFAKAPSRPSTELKSYFMALPDGREFKTAEAMEVAAKQGIPERTAKRLLGEMVTRFLVLDHTRHGIYCKIRKEE
ncbi:MAG: DUF3987 domain-containing protein [Bacteroidales bacterium]|nr:DUF3987 domain-containing protein [Bacteroidales bacterium]